MKKAGKSRKKMMIILISVVLCAALVLGGLMIYGKAQMGKIPGLTFMDALNYTTQGKPDARITVGIIKDGQASFTVYGENGQKISLKVFADETRPLLQGARLTTYELMKAGGEYARMFDLQAKWYL